MPIAYINDENVVLHIVLSDDEEIEEHHEEEEIKEEDHNEELETLENEIKEGEVDE